MSDTRNSTTTTFNTLLFKLIKTAKKISGDNQDDRLRNRMKLAKSTEHESLIVSAGPYFYKYRTPILEGNLETFGPEVMQAELAEHKPSKHTEFATSLFQTLHTAVLSLKSDEREEIFDMARGLIEAYCRFAVCCRTQDK